MKEDSLEAVQMLREGLAELGDMIKEQVDELTKEIVAALDRILQNEGESQ